VPRYQVYGVNSCGAIVGERWIIAESDDEAIAVVRTWGRLYECQVWKGDYRIARVPPAKEGEAIPLPK